jgi:spore maturation protein CgeB
VRVLVVDTYYPTFLAEHYARHPELTGAGYDRQHAALMARHFGTGDAYARELRGLGHEAWTIVANAEPLQAAWAREHGARRLARAAARLPTRIGIAARAALPAQILDAQLAALRPDVVYLQDLWLLSRERLDALRGAGRLVAGQIASAPPAPDVLRGFDLLVTSFPHFVERFRALGVDALELAIGFDPAIHDALRAEGVDPDPDAPRPHPVSFIGSLNPATHAAGTRVLEELCRHDVPLQVWGYGVELLDAASPLRERFQGAAFGLDMHRVLAGSRIAVNRHIDAAEGHANNMRLYETTGDGALLATEAGVNLPMLFEAGREVVTYEGADDLAAALHALLADNERRVAIARAGQERTLREHTYARRIAALAADLGRRLP